MKILFILDPLASIKTYKDTSFAMMVEAAGRGHEIHSRRRRG
jgi:glutathione synthase